MGKFYSRNNIHEPSYADESYKVVQATPGNTLVDSEAKRGSTLSQSSVPMIWLQWRLKSGGQDNRNSTPAT